MVTNYKYVILGFYFLGGKCFIIDDLSVQIALEELVTQYLIFLSLNHQPQLVLGTGAVLPDPTWAP